MGYLISSLTDPSVTPEIYNEYCIYLIHEWDLEGVARSISDEFRAYSTRLGKHASIFAASDQDSYNASFMELMSRNPWFQSTIGDYYNLSPGIIITKPGLPQFETSQDQVFIYTSDEVINLAYKEQHSLSQDLVGLCRYNDKRFIEKILPYSRDTIVKPGPNTNAILGFLREILILEPNWNGIGIRISPIADRVRNAFNHRRNPEEERSQFECVIYQF